MAITRGLELDPQRRWQSVQELGNWLLGAPVTPGGTAPSGGQPIQVGQPGGATKPFSRPTQRLGAMLAQLTNTQLAVALIALTVIAGVVTWAFTPILSKYPLFWYNVDFSAIVAALTYASVRRPRISGAIQAVIATIGGIITQIQLGYPVSSAFSAIFVAILSGFFVEGWIALLPRVKGQTADAWQREVMWLALMAVIATTVVRLPYQLSYALQPAMWVVSALLGGLGWLIGDSIQQTLYFRQYGYQRRGHL